MQAMVALFGLFTDSDWPNSDSLKTVIDENEAFYKLL